jgi:aminopeptidase
MSNNKKSKIKKQEKPNMTTINQAVKKIFEEIFEAKKDEKILILCDKKTKKFAEKIFDSSTKYGKEIVCYEMPLLENNGQEPSKEIACLIKEFDIVLFLTSKSLTHTKARKDANKKGIRIASCPGINEEMLKRTIVVNYEKMFDIENKILEGMSKAKIIRITTKLGTDISFRIYNKKIKTSKFLSEKGSYNNLPLGEVFVSPKEGTANGVYIVDASHAGVGKLDKPIKFIVKNGNVEEIKGGKSAKKLINILESIKDKKAYNIAELGIGTNFKAKITGKILEDEKVFRTCHLALGNNKFFGGKIDVPIHLDGVIQKPTIYFDKNKIMANGKILI